MDEVVFFNCICNCKERSRLLVSFWKINELVVINKDGGEIGILKDVEKSIESRESEIGLCGYDSINKID